MNTYDFFLFAGQSNMAGRGISCPQFPEVAPALISGAGVEFRAISDPSALFSVCEPFGAAENTPDVYAEQFCRMYETLRRENIEHCFLIGIGEYNGPATDISYDAIRNAQYALADQRSDLTVVSRSFETMKARGLMKDAFHYYQAGYNETGQTAGEACAVFVEKSYPLR